MNHAMPQQTEDERPHDATDLEVLQRMSGGGAGHGRSS
jgi:hypothetical protein